MGHKKNKCSARCHQHRPQSRRRGYMPEPGQVASKPIEEPTKRYEQAYHVGYFEEKREANRHCPRRERHRPSSFNFTHTSCIMAIRNYVERIQNTNNKRKKNISTKDNAENLICSLKNDIQAISKYEEEIMCNPGKLPSSDPFFVLSAMMCKINKLEGILITQPNCREQLARRKDMLTMARCIKQSLLDQAHCDERFLQEKQRKLMGLVNSLDVFERNIRCATKGVKKLCCPKVTTNCPEIQLAKKPPCDCTDKEKCAKQCPGKTRHDKALQIGRSRSASPMRLNSSLCNDPCKDASMDPCGNKLFDITGLKVTYTKSHVQKDTHGGERENLQSQVSCVVNDEENCKVTVMKEGKTTCIDDCDPLVRDKMSCLTKIWMESARQLIDACT